MNQPDPQNRRVGRVDIGKLFRSLEKRLAVRLDTAGAVITHGGAKGSASETSWIGTIREFLPSKCLNDARISSEDSCGCSQSAKWKIRRLSSDFQARKKG